MCIVKAAPIKLFIDLNVGRVDYFIFYNYKLISTFYNYGTINSVLSFYSYI